MYLLLIKTVIYLCFKILKRNVSHIIKVIVLDICISKQILIDLNIAFGTDLDKIRSKISQPHISVVSEDQ